MSIKKDWSLLIAFLLFLILQFILFLPIANAQFDTTLGATVTGARIQHDAKHSASVLNASSVAASDAEAVDDWLDSSGNGTHAVAPSSGARPTLDIDGFRGLPCIQGAAGDQFVYSDETWSKNLAGFTWVMAFRNIDTGAAQALGAAYAGANRLRPYLDPTGDNRLYFDLRNPDSTDNSQYPSTATLTNNTDHFLIVQANLSSSSLKIWRDGTNTTTVSLSGTSSTSNTDSDDSALMASDPYGSNTFRGCFAHNIFYGYAMNDTQVGSLQTALEAYWDDDPPPPSGGSSAMLMGVGQ